jgi:very-short-patch-repair endonuclease
VRGRRLNGYKFRRQLPIGPYFADFACMEARLIIELDGESHAGRQGYDAARTRELEARGWHVVRFTNDEVYGDLERVLQLLLAELQLARG